MSEFGGSIRHDRAGRLMRLIGPRPVLLLGVAALNLALIAAFAYVVVDSQALSRREAQQRFKAQATVSAALTASLFGSTAASGQTAAAKRALFHAAV